VQLIYPDRYKSHEVTAARAGRPSGRTYLPSSLSFAAKFIKVTEDSLACSHLRV
jgi:hypothetical protein